MKLGTYTVKISNKGPKQRFTSESEKPGWYQFAMKNDEPLHVHESLEDYVKNMGDINHSRINILNTKKIDELEGIVIIPTKVGTGKRSFSFNINNTSLDGLIC